MAQTIEIYRHRTSSGWSLQATTQLNGEQLLRKPAGPRTRHFTFAPTTGGAPASGDEITSNEVTVTVEDSKITLDQPVAKIDSLKDPTIGGRIVPARSGVEVQY